MENIREEIFEFIKKNCYQYKEEPFTLASSRKSNYYFNLKALTLSPVMNSMLCSVIAEEFHSLLLSNGFNGICGMTMGADPIVYRLSEILSVLPVVVRKEPKGHGTGKQIETIIDPHSDLVLIEDVITTGGSTLKCIKAVREAGYKVSKGIVIIDREEHDKEIFESIGFEVFPLFKKSDFI